MQLLDADIELIVTTPPGKRRVLAVADDAYGYLLESTAEAFNKKITYIRINPRRSPKQAYDEVACYSVGTVRGYVTEQWRVAHAVAGC